MSARKYTPEQLQAEVARPKGKGGRPKKYATEEERKAAKNESLRRTRLRKKHIEAGIVLDEYIAPRKRSYATDEERQEGARESDRRYVAAHLEEHRLLVAARHYSLHH